MQSGGDHTKTAICVGVGLALCCMLPFIICDLYFAYNDGSACLTQDLNAVSFTLKTWLLVDGYYKLAMAILVIITIVMAISNPDGAGGVLGCFACVTCLGSLFTLAWTIIGAIIFWGQLHPAGTCSTPLSNYMWVLLILSFLGICCQVFNSNQNRSS